MAALGALRTWVKGLHLVARTPAVFEPLPARCRLLRVSPAASLCSSRTEPQRSAQPPGTDGRAAREEEEEPEGPDYIPRRKAKNPMMKIGYAWMIGLPTGIIGFILTKRQVDKNRLKQLKIRQRMKNSNEGEYDGSRYRHSAEDVKLEH